MYNSLPNSSTGITPHEIMYGSKLRTDIDRWLPVLDDEGFGGVEDYVDHSSRRQEMLWRDADRNIMDAQARMKKSYDRGKKPCLIQTGDWVLVSTKPRKHAFSPLFEGPWLVETRKDVNLHFMQTGAKRWKRNMEVMICLKRKRPVEAILKAYLSANQRCL